MELILSELAVLSSMIIHFMLVYIHTLFSFGLSVSEVERKVKEFIALVVDNHQNTKKVAEKIVEIDVEISEDEVAFSHERQ